MYHQLLAAVAGGFYGLLSTNQYSSYYFILRICRFAEPLHFTRVVSFTDLLCTPKSTFHAHCSAAAAAKKTQFDADTISVAVLKASSICQFISITYGNTCTQAPSIAAQLCYDRNTMGFSWFQFQFQLWMEERRSHSRFRYSRFRV